MQFPVEEVVPELKLRLQQSPIVILQAPPGAGKSTIVPLRLLKEPWLAGNKIIMLQPRRLAARSVAIRLAQLLDEQPGETVGYRVRFDNVVGKNTRIEVVTEGILTRMLQSDNALENVGLVIFDEFHERSLHADLALALCRQTQQWLRPDLRLLIMSATLDGEKISAALGNAPAVTSAGRQFPVTIRYEAAGDDSIVLATSRMVKKALKEHPGDLLVFLPGAGEIRRVQELLEADSPAAIILPLYGDLPFQKQQQAILPDPSGRRKIVLSTSLAETSLTIEGIAIVIDSGYARVPRFDPRSGLTRLETVRVTRDAADQRAGRAGRLGPGICYRLWPKATHTHLADARQPEILEADLAPLMLELFSWGASYQELNWITNPPAGAVSQATDLLKVLGAIHLNKITERGKEMLRLPTHPRLAHLLLQADSRMEKLLASDIAALLEERDPFPKESGADLTLRIELLRRWRAGERVSADHGALERIERNAAAWRRIFKLEVDNGLFADEQVGKLLLEAYPERIARQIDKLGLRYKLANGRTAKLPDHDALAQKLWLVVAEMDAGSKEGKIFLAAPVHESDLMPLATERQSVEWDHARGVLSAKVDRQVGGLVLSSRPIAAVDASLRIATLCAAFRDTGFSLLNWEEEQQQVMARLLSLRAWRPTEPWPDVSEDALRGTAETWLAPYLVDVYKRADFERLDVPAMLMSLLPGTLRQKFQTLAPEKLAVPSGSMIRLGYAATGEPPVMQVRLQEVFGLLETPTVNEGRTKVMLHLLSPGYKPVQVTQDLKSFWTTTYHEVRKELRMRYPRHHWPEDPWTAEAVRGVKRKS